MPEVAQCVLGMAGGRGEGALRTALLQWGEAPVPLGLAGPGRFPIGPLSTRRGFGQEPHFPIQKMGCVW